MSKFVSRVFVVVAIVAIASPAALACGMKRMPAQAVALNDIFDAIDAVEDNPTDAHPAIAEGVPASVAPAVVEVEATKKAVAPKPAVTADAPIIAEVAQSS